MISKHTYWIGSRCVGTDSSLRIWSNLHSLALTYRFNLLSWIWAYRVGVDAAIYGKIHLHFSCWYVTFSWNVYKGLINRFTDAAATVIFPIATVDLILYFMKKSFSWVSNIWVLLSDICTQNNWGQKLMSVPELSQPSQIIQWQVYKNI